MEEFETWVEDNLRKEPPHPDAHEWFGYFHKEKDGLLHHAMQESA